MPSNAKFRHVFIEKLEDVSLVLFLPLFFVFTGLRTEIGLLNDAYLWKITGLIILVATAGKFLGSALAAKFVGQNWKDSLTIGVLMNTRGLMELVVLNIGYDLGVLTPEIFAMMVIMALVTTFLTGPLLDLINKLFKSKEEDNYSEIANINKYKILISFGKPENSRSLLRLANSFVNNVKDNASITAMHLFQSTTSHLYNVDEYETNCFTPIIDESVKIDQEFVSLFKVTNNVEVDIVEVANKGNFDILLMGIGQSIFEGSLLGKIMGFTTKIINTERIINQVAGKENLFDNSIFDEMTRTVVSKSQIPVGVFIDNNYLNSNNVIIPLFSSADSILINYAQKLISNSGSQISFSSYKNIIEKNNKLKESIRSIEQIAPSYARIVNFDHINMETIQQQSLMIVSYGGWEKLLDIKPDWLAHIPSVLIINQK
jgi:hypothetical protein